MSEATTQTLLASALQGDRPSLARLLSHIERDPDTETEIRATLAGAETESVVIGITGPPGAGKSSLISTLLTHATKSFDRTAVLAVDPSSPFSGGALLGDRVRMQNHGLGDRVLIRSMASKGESGGLARAASTAIQLLEACGWPLILVETLGIGQVELDVMDLATMVAVVLNPGWGDTFQANKAGLTEAGDVFVINKADKDGVQQTRADLQDSLSLLQSPVQIQIFETIAVNEDGVAALWQGIETYLADAQAAGLLEQKLLTRRRRLLMRILQRGFESRIDAYCCSDHGNTKVEKALAGELSIEALEADLFANISQPG